MNNEMKELNRQIKMGWERGFQFGLVLGASGMLFLASGMLFLGFIIKLIW